MKSTATLNEDRPNPARDIRRDLRRSGLADFIAQIPKSYIIRLGKALGRLISYFDVRDRRIVRRNLQFIHPQWSRNQIHSLSKSIFEHLGITLLEFLQMAYLSPGELMHHIQIEGEEILSAALANQRGAVLISAHIGNWEIAWQVCPCYFQHYITGVAKKFRNKQLNRMVENRRTRFGNKLLYKQGALPDMMQTLRQGKIVGLLMDISRRFDGVEVRFFGRRATATPAAALLAIRCKSPIIPAFSHRNAEGRLIIHIEPPVEIVRTGDLRTDLQINTQRITDRVERAVRKYPEQWNWTLKRWKEFYPGLYPESERRRQRIKKKEKRKKNSSRDN